MRVIATIAGVVMLAVTLWAGFLAPRARWTWDLGQGLISLTATLLGVLIAFALNGWIERRRSREEYAQELDACFYELSSLLTICDRLAKQVGNGDYVIDELNRPSAIAALVQNPRLREYGSYPLTLALTSIRPSVDTIRPLLEICRTPQRRPGQMTDAVARVVRLKRLVEFTQVRIEEDVKRLGFGTVISAEERALVERLKDILRA